MGSADDAAAARNCVVYLLLTLADNKSFTQRFKLDEHVDDRVKRFVR